MTPSGEPIGEGHFPRGRSMLRRVHSERAVGLLYGQRGLAIGALNPRAFVGTWEHTHAQLKPFQRLAHTAKAFEAIFCKLNFAAGLEKIGLGLVEFLARQLKRK